MPSKIDIFVKTQLGLDEIKIQQGDILPREARTLLILIDGRKTYGELTHSLSNRKMFIQTGGVEQYFELLIDLEYIESLSNSTKAKPSQIAMELDAEVMELDVDAVELSTIKAISTMGMRPEDRKNKLFNDDSNITSPITLQMDDDFSFSSLSISSLSFSPSNFDTTSPETIFNTIRSKLAMLIERDAAADSQWEFLSELEACQNNANLLNLIAKIYKKERRISRDMDKLSKFLKKHRQQ